jgi:hypothetical protein
VLERIVATRGRQCKSCVWGNGKPRRRARRFLQRTIISVMSS